MSTVAFLASVVDPRVAAAAAKAALRKSSCISCCALNRVITLYIIIITLEEYTNMKDELPSNFKQQSGDADDDKDVTKDDVTPTKEDTPTAEGLVKTAAAAALVSAAVKAKVSVTMLCSKLSATYFSI